MRFFMLTWSKHCNSTWDRGEQYKDVSDSLAAVKNDNNLGNLIKSDMWN